MVVAQLAKRLLLTPDVRSSKLVIRKVFIEHCCLKIWANPGHFLFI